MAIGKSYNVLTSEQIREKVSLCIVDDFQTMTSIMKSSLVRVGFNGHNITTISGTKAAVELIQKLEVYKTYEAQLSWKIPKILFVDWNMPQVTGLDILHKMKNSDDKRISGMIVVMVTAESVKENVVAAIQAGVDNFIAKPLTQKLIEKKLRDISTVLIRKAEKLILKNPDNIHEIIDTLDMAIALDVTNTIPQRIKSEFLTKSQNAIKSITVNKIKSGEESVNEGKYNRAAGNFDSALSLTPSNPKALMEFGKMMMKKTLYDKAVESFESALQFLEKDVEAKQIVDKALLTELLGEAQCRLGLTLEAPDLVMSKSISIYRTAINLYEKHNNSNAKARCYRMIGNIFAIKASELDKRAKKTGLNSSELEKHKHDATENYKHAIKEFTESANLDSNQISTLVKLAHAYSRIGNNEEAENTLKNAHNLKPQDPEAYLEMAKSLLLKADIKSAINYFHLLKDMISTEDIELYEQIIEVLLDNNLPDEAVPFIEIITTERPDLYNNLGISYRRKEQISEAISAYSKAIELDVTGDRVKYLFNRGTAYRFSKNFPLAIQDFYQAFKTDNLFKKAAVQLGNISEELAKLASAYEKESDKNNAIKYLKLAYLADEHSEKSINELMKLNVDPRSVKTNELLLGLGFTDPSIFTDHIEK